MPITTEEGKIVSFIDKPNIAKEKEYIVSSLTEILETFKKINGYEIKLKASSSYKEMVKDAKNYTNELKNIEQQEIKTSIARKKIDLSEMNSGWHEVIGQQKQKNNLLADEDVLVKKTKVSSKEKSAQEKADRAVELELGKQKILQLHEEEAARQKLNQTNTSSASFDASGKYNQGGPDIIKPKQELSFIPTTELEQNVQILQKQETALIANQLQQKNLRKDLTDGIITQKQYDAEINRAIVEELELKKSISLVNTEIKLGTAVLNEERNSLGRANALVALYTNEKKKLNLATAEGKLQNENYNKAIANTTTFITKNADAETIRTKSVGNYGDAISKAGKKAFSSLRTIANILPGIGLAGIFGVLFEGLEKFVTLIAGSIPRITGFGSSIADLQKRMNDVAQAVKQSSAEYEKAITVVNTLTIDIDLAKKGFLDKKEVLNEYNNTIGKTTGQVKTLDEAEQQLVKNGEAYIQMMLLKAAAQIALQGAAQKAFEAELARRKSTDDYGSIVDGFGENNFGSPSQKDLEAQGKREEAARQRRKAAEIKQAEDEKNEKLGIAKSFIAEAAIIANSFHFDLFNGEKNSQTKKESSPALKSISEELNKEFDVYKIYQEHKIKLSEEITSDEKQSFNNRIKALQDFSNETTELIDKEEINQKRNINEKLKTDVANLEREKKKGADIAGINKEIAVKQYNATQELNVVTANAETKRLDVFIVNQKKFTDIVKSEGAKQVGALKKQYQQESDDREKEVKDIERTSSKILEDRTDSYNNEIVLLNKRKLSVEAYDKQRRKIELDFSRDSIKIEIDKQQKLIEKLKLANDIKIRIEDDLKKAEKELSDAQEEDQRDAAKKKIELLKEELKKTIDIIDKESELYKALSKLIKDLSDANHTSATAQQDEIIKGIQKVGEVAQKVFSLMDGILNARTVRIKNEGQAESDRIDKNTADQTTAINQLLITEEEKAARIFILNAKADDQKKKIALRERQAEIDQARFDKFKAIFEITLNTAIAVTKAIDPFSKAIAIAFGAAQLAIAIATPIPKFEMGKDANNKYEGYALTNEKRMEPVLRSDGTMEFSSKRNEIKFLNKDDIVFPSVEAMLSHFGLPQVKVLSDNKTESSSYDTSARIIDAINNLGITTQIVTSGGHRWRNEKISNYNEWVKKYIKE